MELPPGGAAMELPPDGASHPRAQPGDATMPFPDPTDDKLPYLSHGEVPKTDDEGFAHTCARANPIVTRFGSETFRSRRVESG